MAFSKTFSNMLWKKAAAGWPQERFFADAGIVGQETEVGSYGKR